MSKRRPRTNALGAGLIGLLAWSGPVFSQTQTSTSVDREPETLDLLELGEEPLDGATVQLLEQLMALESETPEQNTIDPFSLTVGRARLRFGLGRDIRESLERIPVVENGVRGRENTVLKLDHLWIEPSFVALSRVDPQLYSQVGFLRSPSADLASRLWVSSLALSAWAPPSEGWEGGVAIEARSADREAGILGRYGAGSRRMGFHVAARADLQSESTLAADRDVVADWPSTYERLGVSARGRLGDALGDSVHIDFGYDYDAGHPQEAENARFADVHVAQGTLTARIGSIHSQTTLGWMGRMWSGSRNLQSLLQAQAKLMWLSDETESRVALLSRAEIGGLVNGVWSDGRQRTEVYLATAHKLGSLQLELSGRWSEQNPILSSFPQSKLERGLAGGVRGNWKLSQFMSLWGRYGRSFEVLSLSEAEVENVDIVEGGPAIRWSHGWLLLGGWWARSRQPETTRYGATAEGVAQLDDLSLAFSFFYDEPSREAEARAFARYPLDIINMLIELGVRSPSVPPHAIVDLRSLVYLSSQWTLQAVVSNLTDVQFRSFGDNLNWSGVDIHLSIRWSPDQWSLMKMDARMNTYSKWR